MEKLYVLVEARQPRPNAVPRSCIRGQKRLRCPLKARVEYHVLYIGLGGRRIGFSWAIRCCCRCCRTMGLCNHEPAGECRHSQSGWHPFLRPKNQDCPLWASKGIDHAGGSASALLNALEPRRIILLFSSFPLSVAVNAAMRARKDYLFFLTQEFQGSI